MGWGGGMDSGGEDRGVGGGVKVEEVRDRLHVTIELCSLGVKDGLIREAEPVGRTLRRGGVSP